MNGELFDVLIAGQFAKAEELLEKGADINARDERGETLLDRIIPIIGQDGDVHSVVRFMLTHGADPSLTSHEGSGPLFGAAILQDTELFRMLLDHGADPNRQHDMGEILYDWAEFDYRFETYDLNLPEEPTNEDKATEGAWLQFLDRIAIKYDKRRPDYLLLLRERGALTGSELRKLRQEQE